MTCTRHRLACGHFLAILLSDGRLSLIAVRRLFKGWVVLCPNSNSTSVLRAVVAAGRWMAHACRIPNTKRAPLESGEMSSMPSREASLRELIQERDRNGRARSELALLVFQPAKNEENDTRKEEIHWEAMQLANEAVQVALAKPFGCAVRSMILEHHDERMAAIRQALQILDGCDPSFWMSHIDSLIRLLLEPRKHFLSGNLTRNE